MSQAPSGHDTKFVSRPSPCCARTARRVARTLRVVSCTLPRVSQPPAPYRGALLRRIATLAALYHDTTVAPQPRYNVLYRDSPWPGYARVRCRMPCTQADRVVACIVDLPRHIMGVAWPYHGPCSCAQLPCVTIQSIVS